RTGKVLLPLDPKQPYGLYLVRASGHSAPSVAELETAVRRVDDRLQIRRIGPEVAVELATGQVRFLATALGLFGSLTVLLAVVGIVGLVSRFVVSRTREIGIRIALGADPPRVCRLVMGQTLASAGAGVSLGLAVAYWWSSALKTVLAKIDPHDVPSFAIAA